tara:strand:+ start:1329 stop:1742 length:414 start_codon:yes stop_codon:yes gene_type:complete
MSLITGLAIDDELPLFVREGSIKHWNYFAAVNDEFAAHHWDQNVAKSEGFSAPFCMAPLQVAFFHTMLRDWMGNEGRIMSVEVRLKNPFFEGSTLTASGKVTSINRKEGETLVDLELGETDEDKIVIAIGVAQLSFK